MGASWIHGITDNPLTEIADTLGMVRFPTSYENILALDTNGEIIDYNALAANAEGIMKVARKSIENGNPPKKWMY